MSIKIDDQLVHHLIATQVPQWKDFTVRAVACSGWDNRSFHLGEQMLVRMPSASKYAAQVEKEYRWLPILAPLLPLQTPVPLFLGEQSESYPWRWSVYCWIEGETAASARITDLCDFAISLAQFLHALQTIDPTGGPVSGPHNFYRGGSLTMYDDQTRQAIDLLKDQLPAEVATEVWKAALSTTWNGSPVWVHGDISAENLLVKEGRLSAVIDFGQLAVGDPACDVAIAWTLFTGKNREAFRKLLPLDDGTWARGRAWALWKALIIASGITQTNTDEGTQAWRIINELLADYKTN